MVVLEKLCHILDRENKKNAIKIWKTTLKLWKRKLNSIKKLLQWNKMKITSKVLHKWYNQFKYEESIYNSGCHKDYIISMYEILGNTQNLKQFAQKYHPIFVFMINRYLKQILKGDLKNHLKKVVVSIKKDRSHFYLIDLTEQEKGKSKNHFLSPIKESKILPEYVNVMMSSKLIN